MAHITSPIPNREQLLEVSFQLNLFMKKQGMGPLVYIEMNWEQLRAFFAANREEFTMLHRKIESCSDDGNPLVGKIRAAASAMFGYVNQEQDRRDSLIARAMELAVYVDLYMREPDNVSVPCDTIFAPYLDSFGSVDLTKLSWEDICGYCCAKIDDITIFTDKIHSVVEDPLLSEIRAAWDVMKDCIEAGEGNRHLFLAKNHELNAMIHQYRSERAVVLLK